MGFRRGFRRGCGDRRFFRLDRVRRRDKAGFFLVLRHGFGFLRTFLFQHVPFTFMKILLHPALAAGRTFAAFLAVAGLAPRAFPAQPFRRRQPVLRLPGGPFRDLGVVGLVPVDLDFLLDHALDGAEQAPFLRADEGDRRAGSPGARRAPDPVHVGLRLFRKVVVEDVRDVVHVDAARGDVRRDQHPRLAFLKGRQRARPHGLGLVAMDRVRFDLALCEFADDLVRAVARPRENQHLLVLRMRVQEVDEQVALVPLVDEHELLVDLVHRRLVGRNLDRHRILHQRLRELHDLFGKGRREELRMALVGQAGDHLLDVGQEAHVQHPVGLVQHELLDFVQKDVLLLHQVEQASRSRDDDLRALGQRLDLGSLPDTAKHDGELRTEELAVVGAALRDLRGEFACRRENERARVFGFDLFRVRRETV